MTIPEAEIKGMIEHPNDPDALTSVHKLVLDLDLDTVVVEQSEWKPAQTLFERSLAEREITPGLKYRYTARSICYLAINRSQLHQYEEAEASFRKVIALDEAVNGKDTNWGAMSNLGWPQVNRRRYAEGEMVMRQLLPLLQKGLGVGTHQQQILQTGTGIDSPHALGCMSALMAALAGQGRFPDARELNKEGLEITRNMNGKYYEAEGSEQCWK